MATKQKQKFQLGFTTEDKTPIRSNVSAVSKIKAEAGYNMQFIEYSKIVPNKFNQRYSMLDIESLSQSIMLMGLLHNLVTTKPDSNGQVRLISGERRWRAIGIIKEQNESKFFELFPDGLIPCKIQTPDSELDEQIQLITANASSRQYNLSDRLNDINELITLLEQKKERGEISNIQNELSIQLQITERQVRKYMNLNKLLPELYQAFETKQISMETAAKIAILGETEQSFLFGILSEEGTITEDDIESAKVLKKQKEQTEEQLHKLNTDISTLKELREQNTNVDLSSMIEKKILSKESAKNTLQKSMSQKELTKLRKLTKANKALDQMDVAIEKLQKIWEHVSDDVKVDTRLDSILLQLGKFKPTFDISLSDESDIIASQFEQNNQNHKPMNDNASLIDDQELSKSDSCTFDSESGSEIEAE